MPEKLRVLFLPKWYPNKFDSLDGNFVENHARAIAPYCDLAILFAHSDPSLTEKYQLEIAEPFGYPEIRVYFKKPKTGIKLLDQIIIFFRYLKAQSIGYKNYLKNNEKPDFTHVHVLSRTSIFALILHFFNRIPFFITDHWSGYQKSSKVKINPLKKWVSKIATKYALGVSTVSHDLQEVMISLGFKGNYSTIPNVIDTSLFKPLPRNNKKTRFIHISSLSKRPKNLHNIIKNLAEIALTQPEFEFILIGYGEEQEEMLQLIDSSSIKTQTKFLGKLSNEAVAEELAKSDALLLFSTAENLPCVILEAYSCGCPVISSDVGGIREVMSPELGYLVESENNEAFKFAIRQFLDGKTNFDSEVIRNYALNNFNKEIVGKAFIDFYQKNS